MLHKLTIAGLCAVLCTATALAQSNPQPDTTSSTSGPSAWVYVSHGTGPAVSEIRGWTAGPGGKLTPLPGSPYPAKLDPIASNGKYLFGGTSAGNGMMETWRMQSNGSLTYAATVDAASRVPCGTPSGADYLFLDHTGASLYDFYNCTNTYYQAWNVVKSTGALTFLNTVPIGDVSPNYSFSFIGNNVYGYTAASRDYTETLILGFKRNADGSLTNLNLAQVYPKVPSGYGGWSPWLAAADPTNHLAIPMQLLDKGGDPVSPFKLATYTVNTSTGAISTSSTYANMPKVAVGTQINAIRMSPSGKLLAVGGSAGLQVFHFNGANPITHYTGLISSVPITDIRWDNNNHLYAISNTGNRLVVFTVTPTSWKWIATYSVNKPLGIAVQPLPVPWQ
jgi:hypothetical protein